MTQILVVDDDHISLDLIKKGLLPYKDRFTTLTASNGRQAMEVLKIKKISLLVTDIMMPEVNGLELLSHVTQVYPRLTCIAMTAHDVSRLEGKLPNSLLHVLAKPFGVRDLTEIILAHLEEDAPEGSLKGISVPGFAQLIELEGATTAFQVRAKDKKEKGLFVFRQGTLVNAKLGSLTGEEAAILILRMKNPVIRILKQGTNHVPKAISRSLGALILEAMKQKDEGE